MTSWNDGWWRVVKDEKKNTVDPATQEELEEEDAENEADIITQLPEHMDSKQIAEAIKEDRT